MKVLLIGRKDNLLWVLPPLLSRAGFLVDTISSSSLMKSSKFVRHAEIARQSLIPHIAKRLKENYDWIIVTDDSTLGHVVRSDLSIEEKLKVLPIQNEENFSHLFSKIGLFKTFSAHGVKTPPSFVAHNLKEALSQADLLGYPILLKIDASNGGGGIFECKTPADLCTVGKEIFEKPVLIQKKLLGRELDLSALYLKGDLIHFGHAKIERTFLNRFGPSCLRTYRPLSAVNEGIFQELSQIGKALGVHGFTNIACIESEKGERFYFEADMRPNVWVDIPRYFGDDPAPRIQNWFSHKEKLSYPVPTLPNQPSQIVIPYFLRLKWTELLCNRYRVWDFIPREDPKLLIRISLKAIWLRFVHVIASRLKQIIPRKHHKKLRVLRKVWGTP